MGISSVFRFSVFGALVIAGLSNAAVSVSDLTTSCAGAINTITGADFQNVTVNFATFIPAGTNLSLPIDGNLSTCYSSAGGGGAYQVVSSDICRIAMRVTTSSESEISMETWLPANWTGRFLQTGNGGLDGCIQYTDMDYASSMGFATSGANNGHNGTSGLSFYNNPETIKDFAWRSLTTAVQIGKAVTTLFYSSQYTKSYYLGCSTGGRQGFKMAQDYPDLFDGILAGAPAISFNNLTSWSGKFYVETGNNASATFIPTSMWLGTIHEMVLDQCDGLDGATDGIIEDPSVCHPNAAVLLCGANQTDNCLTQEQVNTVTEVYSDYKYDDGTLIHPRMNPGSELIAAFVYYAGNQFPYTTDWFRYAVFDDPGYDPATQSVQDAAKAASVNPGDIESFSGDLSAFQARGGKLLHYHGSADFLITSLNSPRYYKLVSETMDLAPSELDSFYRLFRVSGMGHCFGGDGAWEIGNMASGATATNAQNNVLLRIVDWVENGAAPETITGTKFVNDTPSLGVDFSRDHCRFPLRNTCVDPKNYQDPRSWKCVEPEAGDSEAGGGD